MRTCFRTELLPGQRFGNWTVISKDVEESQKRKYTMYICECNCGKIQSVRASRLTNGYTTNCAECGAKKMSINKRIKNRYDLSKEYGVGWSSNTNKPFYFDKEQYERIKDYTWYENTTTGYLYTTDHGKNIMFHRFVMNAKFDEIIDHIHGVDSKFDNRMCNLRIATKGQNNINTSLRSNNNSGVTGVWWKANLSKWEARIGVNGKPIYLGYYDNFEDAVKARKEAENKYYGEYSYDNSQNIHKGGY